MPTYEFRCPNGHEFERFYRTISAGVSELPCPECGAVAIRQLSVGGLVFKGSGFYLTDYGKNAHRGSAPIQKTSDEKSDKKSDEKSDKKSDVKADGKADAKPETPKAQSSETKADSSKPKAESPKPKNE